MKYSETKNEKYFAAGILFFLLSLLSKITGIPFIVLIPLMLYIKRKEIKPSLVVFASLALLTIVYYIILIKSLPGFARPYEYVETPLPYISDWSVKLGTALYSLFYYFKLLVAPVQFSFYYGINFIELKPLLSLVPMVSLLFHLTLLGTGVYFSRKTFSFHSSFSFISFKFRWGQILFSRCRELLVSGFCLLPLFRFVC